MYNLPAISPFIIIAATTVVIMLLTAFYRRHTLIMSVTLLGIILSLYAAFFHTIELPNYAQGIIFISNFSSYFIQITLIAAALVVIVSHSYFKTTSEQKEEYYILLLCSVLGAMVMVTSQTFITFFVGIELLSIPLYVLMAYLRGPLGVEASIKYLILASASTSFLLFGMALLYAISGSTNLSFVTYYLNNYSFSSALAVIGIAMIIVGIGFKLSLAPFHMWTPDVYQGSPAPITAFLATASKGGAFSFLIYLFANLNKDSAQTINIVLAVISILSMFVGNLLALKQTSIKRILACSSIAHMGYLLIPLIISGVLGVASSLFYLGVYFITTVGAFSVIAILSKEGKEFDYLPDFKGLYYKNKWLAVVLATMMFSLAGIPLTAGFMSKLYIIIAGVKGTQLLLVWMLIINSAIGLYYYLKVVYTIFKPIDETEQTKVFVPVSASIVLAISLLIILWIGVAPNELMTFVNYVLK
jgi:NADH-quinone oxidoreductase subunit N